MVVARILKSSLCLLGNKQYNYALFCLFFEIKISSDTTEEANLDRGVSPGILPMEAFLQEWLRPNEFKNFLHGHTKMFPDTKYDGGIPTRTHPPNLETLRNLIDQPPAVLDCIKRLEGEQSRTKR